MTIDSTEAKIGRLMKKRENILLVLVPRLCLGTHCLRGSASLSGLRGGASRQPVPRQSLGTRILRLSDWRRRTAKPQAAFQPRQRMLLDQPLDDVEEHRRQEDAEECHAEHAAEHRDAEDLAHLRPGP